MDSKLVESGQDLVTLSDEELVALMKSPESSMELVGLAVLERIVRHSKSCSDLECGFIAHQL